MWQTMLQFRNLVMLIIQRQHSGGPAFGKLTDESFKPCPCRERGERWCRGKDCARERRGLGRKSGHSEGGSST